MVINNTEVEKLQKKRKRGWIPFPFQVFDTNGTMKASCSASTASSHRHVRVDKSRHVYRYLRGVLWFFFLLYLLTCGPDLLWLLASPSFAGGEASTIEHHASHHGLHSTVSLPTFFSRALVESSNSTVMQQPKELLFSTSGLMEDLKVFVYDLPSRFNRDWLSNERCSTHLFAAEVAIHKALLASSFRTLNPLEAHFFFVSIYASCNFSTVNGFPAVGHARPLFASAVSHIASAFPFWNRSNGADHVFIATHDHGACFHTMEDVARKDGIPEFLKSSIIVQTFGVKGQHPCQDAALTVQIPPYVRPEAIGKALAERKGKRNIWVFFRGKMEIHPKNISGRVYSKGVRTEIWRKYSRRKRYYIKRERAEGYLSEIARSVFCLCPLGWAPWSPRIVESVALGCVPVIIADDIRLPFPDAVPWPDISLTVAERDVGRLGRILAHVAATNLSTIQRNLWREGNRRSLLFNVPLRQGDATWHVFHELARYRRSTLASSY